MSSPPRSIANLQQSLSVALQPSRCGRHLVRYTEPNEPFFYLGDTAWELLHRLDDADAEAYLRNRAAKGFNSVMVVIVAEQNGLEYPSREGHFPFLPAAGSTTAHYIPDVYRPNPAYYEFVDRVVALAASMGITISLVPTWGRYVCGGFYEKPIIFDTDSAQAFGRFIGERYPFHPFVLGGDSVFFGGVDPSTLELKDYGPVREAMARGLIEGEAMGARRPAHEHGAYETLIAYHPCSAWFSGQSEAIGSAQFPDAEWLTWDCVQSGHAPPNTNSVGQFQAGDLAICNMNGVGPYEPIRKMYNTMRPDGRPRPVIDLEPHYEATHQSFNPSNPMWTADDIRTGAWQTVFAGTCGYTYGCNSIWQMHNSDSKTHPPLSPPVAAHTNWYLELDLSAHYFSRRPDSSFILSNTNEPTDGTSALDRLIQGLCADSWALVHLPYGGTVKVDIVKALGHCDGDERTYRAWWVDPKTGGRACVDKFERRAVQSGGELELTSPSEGALDKDWVLLLETFSI